MLAVYIVPRSYDPFNDTATKAASIDTLRFQEVQVRELVLLIGLFMPAHGPSAPAFGSPTLKCYLLSSSLSMDGSHQADLLVDQTNNNYLSKTISLFYGVFSVLVT